MIDPAKDSETGTKEATLLTEPNSKGYQVTQVYPIVAGKTEWILCLGTRLANLPQDILEVRHKDHVLRTTELKMHMERSGDISLQP